MGMFFDERQADKLLPELKNFLERKLNRDVSVNITFHSSCGVDDEGINFRFSGKLEKQFYGRFSMTAMPGNCGIVVSHDLYLSENIRAKGIGTFLQIFKKKIARE